MLNKIRVRFAPSPTGFLHLGNIRIALLNYMFAHQKNGKFVLRIEDTDKKRNVNEAGLEILQDLKWLGLRYNEGPVLGGNYGPYFQSERTKIYESNLSDLVETQKAYRCFCSKERLEKMREDQLAKGEPPRYDRRCLNLSDDRIKQKLAAEMPFIWRLRINHDEFFEINDMARGKIKFEMKNFSDFAITRQDGSFTFLFTNFMDDWKMNITHVIRGEDHLSNTAMQAALYDAFAVNLPIFWHLPMMCNKEGKKLSKRDFGFSLKDLKKDGFLPQTICNYLGIVGCSFDEEIQSLGELVKNFDFDNMHSSGPTKFDLEKLIWINHKWVDRLSEEKLLEHIKPFLHEQIEESKKLEEEKLKHFLSLLKSDIKTLKDIGDLLGFYFKDPIVDELILEKEFGKDDKETILELIRKNLVNFETYDLFLKTMKKEAKEKGLKFKPLFGILRYLLIGKLHGPSMSDIFEILEDEKIKRRLLVF